MLLTNTIKCSVSNDKISSEETPLIYHKNTKFLRVSFSKDWRGYNTVASFFFKNEEYAMLIQNGRCQIPKEALESGYFRLSIIGLYRDGTRKETKKILAIKEG